MPEQALGPQDMGKFDITDLGTDGSNVKYPSLCGALDAMLKGPTQYVAEIGDGSTKVFVLHHNLGQQLLLHSAMSMYDGSPQDLKSVISWTNANETTLTFLVAPPAPPSDGSSTGSLKVLLSKG